MGEKTRLTYETCFAEWDGESLVVGNESIRREWIVNDGRLYARSLLDVSAQTEWLAALSDKPSLTPAGRQPFTIASAALTQLDTRPNPVEAPSLRVRLGAETDAAEGALTFQIYPGVPGVTVCLGLSAASRGGSNESDTPGGHSASALSEATAEDTAPDTGSEGHDVIEALSLAPNHLKVIQVSFEARTDFHNELLFEREWLLHTSENNLGLQGCLFILEDTATERGLVCLKQAPLPEERPLGCDRDVVIHGKDRSIALCGHGISPDGGEGYPSTILCYQGGVAGRTECLQQLQRAVRTYDDARDGLFLCNTWGDRSQDSRINEPFVYREIEAGQKLGVEVVQIDDGWQKGRSTNSTLPGGIREGFWESDPDYWTPHPERFPNGFGGLVEKAREAGMQFGLWFWPDNSGDLANWEKDAQAIVRLHQIHRIDYFKIDGVTVRSKAGERNLHRFFDRVHKETGGRVVFDLDITASVRPGYFGEPNVGPLFVENRYTDWHRYWPHQTLRNLWKLARYVDPLRLRFEFLNHTRNTDLYADDPLAPSAYGPDCLFATVMMCSPLGWFEASNLPAEYIDQVAPLISIWRAHRGRLFEGTVHPIGSAPDGYAWTGFVSVSPEGGGYLLAFRELNPDEAWRCALSLFGPAAHRVELLGGKGSVSPADGALAVRVPDPLGFVFARLDPQ